MGWPASVFCLKVPSQCGRHFTDALSPSDKQQAGQELENEISTGYRGRAGDSPQSGDSPATTMWGDLARSFECPGPEHKYGDTLKMLQGWLDVPAEAVGGK